MTNNKIERYIRRKGILKTGMQFYTATDRITNPAPKIDLEGPRKILNTQKRIFQWLIDECVLEATYRNDITFLRVLATIKVNKAKKNNKTHNYADNPDFGYLEEYLFYAKEKNEPPETLIQPRFYKWESKK